MHQNDHNSKKEESKKLTLCLGLTQPKKVWNKDLQKKDLKLKTSTKHLQIKNQQVTTTSFILIERKKMSSR
jgi:hypothetical protein